MKKPVFIALLLVSLVSVFLANTPLPTILSYRFFPDYPTNETDTLKVSGLKEPVSVVFDDFGIPHIEAKNLSDLVRATGFVQARYRGFQLDLLRSFAAGRLSELLGNQEALGSTTVEFDLAMRGWGFEKLADIDLKTLPKRDREILEAFTSGINQGLKKYPSIEHRILGMQPRPWTYQDTLLVGLLQAWSITHNWEQEAVRFSLALELGSELAQKIYPLDPLEGEATIRSGDESTPLPPKAAPEALEFLESIARVKPSENLQSALGDLMQIRPAASNAWVVGKKLSASGSPILHNDMHLTHSLPSLIFLQHLKMPGLNISGATMPGLPFMISGYNGKLAWGVTSAVADVVDLVIEKEDPTRAGFALNEKRECPIVKERVLIKVKGEQPKTFEQRKTCNGTLFNDMYPGFLPENSPMLAVRFQTPKVQESFGNLLDANRASNVYELRRALMNIPAPIQNVMAADDKGNIAFFSTGSVPKRKGHRGAFPVPGWLSRYEWQGWMSEDEMPYLYNPPEDFLVNANNPARSPFTKASLFQVDAGPSYRFRRIRESLLALPIKNQQGLQKLQTDNLLVRAKDLAPVVFEALSQAELNKQQAQALSILKKWDHTSGAESVGSAVFMEVYRQTINSVLEDKVSKSAVYAFLKQRYAPAIADSWFKDPTHPVWDNPKTKEIETRDERILASYQAALTELTARLGDDMRSWQWGQLHSHRPSHPFGKKSILDFFNLEKMSMPGGLDSVWKAHFNLNDQDTPFKVVAGPVYRFSIDLANPEDARYSTDTGASGWPLSPHYGDQYESWKKGELIRVQRDMLELKKKHPQTILEFVP